MDDGCPDYVRERPFELERGIMYDYEFPPAGYTVSADGLKMSTDAHDKQQQPTWMAELMRAHPGRDSQLKRIATKVQDRKLFHAAICKGSLGGREGEHWLYAFAEPVVHGEKPLSGMSEPDRIEDHWDEFGEPLADCTAYEHDGTGSSAGVDRAVDREMRTLQKGANRLCHCQAKAGASGKRGRV